MLIIIAAKHGGCLVNMEGVWLLLFNIFLLLNQMI